MFSLSLKHIAAFSGFRVNFVTQIKKIMAKSPKKGLMLVNLGTPDSPSRWDVYRYLREFLTDARVIDYPWVARQALVQLIIAPLRSGSSSALYRQLWTPEGSPLKVYGMKVAEGLQHLLGDAWHVELAMRYQNPSIADAWKRLKKQNITHLYVLPLFPQYASATTGSVHDEVMSILRKEQTIPDITLINSYCDFKPMIQIFADNARKFDLSSYDHFLFSYHGLPQRQLKKADACGHCLIQKDCCLVRSAANQFCYSAQCHATTRAIVEELQLTEGSYTTTFQSRLGPDKWAQPYTSEVLDHWAEKGAKKLLVFSPAFVADCLETLIEISVEYQEEFTEKGGDQVDLVPSLNDDPRWISALRDLLLSYVK
jgi:ferrochelatase